MPTAPHDHDGTAADASPVRLHLRLPSTHASLEQVVEATDALLDQHVEDEDFAYRVLLLASEAFTNAIEHGNALEASKEVEYELVLMRDQARIFVADEGAGFDPEAVRDPLADENLERDGGRGLFLMQAMADEMHFDDDGRRITMTLYRRAQDNV